MSTFKDQIASDITDVFFEVTERNEFPTTHTIDGVSYTQVIVDSMENIERQKNSALNNTNKYGEGIFRKELLFYIPKTAYNKSLPSVGRAMMFDSKRYIVVDAIDEDGVYSISLEAKSN